MLKKKKKKNIYIYVYACVYIWYDMQIGKWCKKLALVLTTLVSPKKQYSEYDCNCQEENDQKHYDDQHQV